MTSPVLEGMYPTLLEGEIALKWETSIVRFDSSLVFFFQNYLVSHGPQPKALLSCNKQRHDLCLALFLSRERRLCFQHHCKDQMKCCVSRRSEQCKLYLEKPAAVIVAAVVRLPVLVSRKAFMEKKKTNNWYSLSSHGHEPVLLLRF